MTKRASRVDIDAVLIDVKELDSLGRLVIPAPIRWLYGMEGGTSVEFLVDGDLIVIRRYEPVGQCVLCDSVSDEVVLFMGRPVCETCRADAARKITAPAVGA